MINKKTGYSRGLTVTGSLVVYGLLLMGEIMGGMRSFSIVLFILQPNIEDQVQYQSADTAQGDCAI